MKLDHLVVVAKTLDDGARVVEDMLGAKMVPGGRHDLMGTHNRLLSLGPDAYLEVIAIDPDAARPDRKRWFGMDGFDGPPRLCNWAANTEDLPGALGSAPIGMGEIVQFSRGDLEWAMAVPRSGRWPEDNVLPALLQWKGARAQGKLPESGCKLKRIVIRHPDSERIGKEWPAMAAMPNVSLEIAGLPALEAEIVTARGLVTLSSLTETA